LSGNSKAIKCLVNQSIARYFYLRQPMIKYAGGYPGNLFGPDLIAEPALHKMFCQDHLSDLGLVGKMPVLYFYDLLMVESHFVTNFRIVRFIYLFKIAFFTGGGKLGRKPTKG